MGRRAGLPAHSSPTTSLIIILYLIQYGSSLMSKKRAQNEKPDDLNTGMLSVLNRNEMLSLLDRKPLCTNFW